MRERVCVLCGCICLIHECGSTRPRALCAICPAPADAAADLTLDVWGEWMGWR